MKNKIDKTLSDTMHKNPSNWKGVFYFNRNDPRIIAPKFIPTMGWTFNFANPYTYISLVSIIAVFVLSKYLLK